VNGVAGTGVPMAAIPGGGTNVLARTLGYPKDAVEATALLCSKIRDGVEPRTVNLGRVNGRAFAFGAGIGFDAQIVRRVEANPKAKRRYGELFFVVAGLREYAAPTQRPRPTLTLRHGDRVVEGIRIAICGNSDPFTFLGKRPFRVVPGARLEGGLDLTAITTTRIHTILRVLFSSFGRAGHTAHRSVVALHDVDEFDLHADRPVMLQVDGDLAGHDVAFRFQSDPGALRVLA
ncbi:MAG: diacylglycerol/lipid kinase family protein, partial [Actinomycetota bacterium]